MWLIQANRAPRGRISLTPRGQRVSPGLPPAGEAAHGAGAVSISRIPAKQRPPSHTETTMYPTISFYLIQARTADLHHDAQRDIMARAARGLGRRRRPGLRPWVLRRTG